MAASKTLVIVGAGALGSMTAYLAARAGHRVTVYDPAPLGHNASGVAAGMLAPAFEALLDPASADHFPLLRAARDLWPSIAAELHLALDRSGAMAVGERADAEAWVGGLRALGADASLFEAPAGRWGALTADDWRLDAVDALAALRSAALGLGVVFEADLPSQLDADAVVIATGASQIEQGLAPEISRLVPIKGHILRAAGAFEPGPVLRAPGIYLCRTPRSAILGATMEVGRSDHDIDPAIVERLVAAGAQLAEGLEALDWRAASGVRAATPDALPMAGPSQLGGGRLILAVGARRNGWLLAPMVAGVVLDALEGRRGATAALFDPARFGPNPG